MKRLLIAALLLATPVVAQPVQKLVTLKYADPQAIQNLIRMFGVDVTSNEQMKVMALSGAKEKVAAAEEAIKQLDVPSAAQKNIEITVYFVAGSDQAGPGAANSLGNPIPQELQSTVTQLKSSFPFKNYGLLDVLSLRARSGVSAETSGQYGKRITQFKVSSATLDADGSMIRLDHVKAGLRNPLVDQQGKVTFLDTGISADVVDVKEGQRLVIGRSSMDGPEKALFLVLIAKVIN
ncbi:MAG TPA: hypothetical protein VNY05_30325 [Candidatus Acidoferrales bacterium]|jgi:hypothetical protein|nr:hypothetical protein [Candidatus Acidoferrales bacterium]